MKKCNYCSNKILDTDEYCPYCGKKSEKFNGKAFLFIVIIVFLGIILYSFKSKNENIQTERQMTPSKLAKTLISKEDKQIINEFVAPTDFSCPNTPPTRVSTGDKVSVTLLEKELRLRNDPSLVSQRIEGLYYGEKMLIISGPVCADGYIWWNVELENGITGWVAEGDINYYYLQRIN